MNKLNRYLGLYRTIFIRSMVALLINRSDFFIWTVVHLLEIVVNIVFFQAIFLRAGNLGGWNIYEVLILLGFMEFTMGFGGITFYPLMYGFSDMIRKGNLDGKLVKPADIQFLVTFPWLDDGDMITMVTGGMLMVYGSWHLHLIYPALALVMFLIVSISSYIILYSFIVLLISSAFLSSKFDSLHNIYWSFQSLGRYPASVFKGTAYFIFMYVIPIGLVSSVPARTLAGVIDPVNFVVSIVMATTLFFISRRVFLDQVKNYSSASS